MSDATQQAVETYIAYCKESFGRCEVSGMARDFAQTFIKACPDEEAAYTVYVENRGFKIMGQVLHRWLAHDDETRYHALLGAVRGNGATEEEIDELLFKMVEGHPNGKAFADATEDAVETHYAA